MIIYDREIKDEPIRGGKRRLKNSLILARLGHRKRGAVIVIKYNDSGRQHKRYHRNPKTPYLNKAQRGTEKWWGRLEYDYL